jgi:hypothetical protein
MPYTAAPAPVRARRGERTPCRGGTPPIIERVRASGFGCSYSPVDAARGAGCTDLTLLNCTSTYPASPEYTNLRTIRHLREQFGCAVGLSDHSMGIGAVVAAFSLEPAELASLATERERVWRALGTIRYGPTAADERAVLRRRSLSIAADLEAGDVGHRHERVARRTALSNVFHRGGTPAVPTETNVGGGRDEGMECVLRCGKERHVAAR